MIFDLTYFGYGVGLVLLPWVAGLVVGFTYNIIARTGRS
jgi:hypothetical protein